MSDLFTCAGTAGWRPFHSHYQSSSLAASKKKKKNAKKGVNQADLQLAWNYFKHFERKCWRLQAEEGRNLEMKT